MVGSLTFRLLLFGSQCSEGRSSGAPEGERSRRKSFCFAKASDRLILRAGELFLLPLRFECPHIFKRVQTHTAQQTGVRLSFALSVV